MKILAILLSLLMIASQAFAEDINITIAWDPNQEPDLMEYRLKIRVFGEQFGAPIVIKGATQKTIALPKGVMHGAVLEAVNTSNVPSPPTDELVFQVLPLGEIVPPATPTGLKRTAALRVTIESSKNLKIWSDVMVKTVSISSHEFFRLRLSEG